MQQNNNPFQRNNRSRNSPRNRPDGSRGGYQTWKTQKVAPLEVATVPKEKVLTPDDFPALPTAPQSSKRVPDKNSWTKPETSMAERMKEQIQKDEETRLRCQVEEEEEKLDVIPLSSWMRGKYLAKKREEEVKKREMEEEEENYRWQISKQMIPDPPEPEMETEGYESEEVEEGEWPVEEEHE